MPAAMRNGCVHAMVLLALAWTALWPSQAGACGGASAVTPQYLHRAHSVATRLGVRPGYALAHGWTLQPEASALVSAGQDIYGRPLRLAPLAATALDTMVAAAARDGVSLQVVSGYRSFRTQRQLVRRKLDHGRPLASVLQVNALPGFSEHHSGCALDLTTPGVPAADAAFADTPAFAWLTAHAGRFGFVLSYPVGNARGIDFEPWHWRYRGALPLVQHQGAAPSGRAGAIARIWPAQAGSIHRSRTSTTTYTEVDP
jgi:D-alanyl-D-alanine carboxypeptidase